MSAGRRFAGEKSAQCDILCEFLIRVRQYTPYDVSVHYPRIRAARDDRMGLVEWQLS